jgi:hypothetical protein
MQPSGHLVARHALSLSLLLSFLCRRQGLHGQAAHQGAWWVLVGAHRGQQGTNIQYMVISSDFHQW